MKERPRRASITRPGVIFTPFSFNRRENQRRWQKSSPREDFCMAESRSPYAQGTWAPVRSSLRGRSPKKLGNPSSSTCFRSS